MDLHTMLGVMIFLCALISFVYGWLLHRRTVQMHLLMHHMREASNLLMTARNILGAVGVEPELCTRIDEFFAQVVRESQRAKV
jgi:hypothetical protein